MSVVCGVWCGVSFCVVRRGEEGRRERKARGMEEKGVRGGVVCGLWSVV